MDLKCAFILLDKTKMNKLDKGAMKSFLDENEYKDIWRISHSTERDYNLYSLPHNS